MPGDILVFMRYEGNPKHKEPWQPGRKGSLCPSDIDVEGANHLLQQSLSDNAKRYAVDDRGRPFCAQASNAEGTVWHGYPVGFEEVPERIWRQWLRTETIRRADLKTFRKRWHEEAEP